MSICITLRCSPVVALRKESVDRNRMEVDGVSYDVWSLSARRAWIEMLMVCQAKKYSGVALRKESVDRNTFQIRITPVDSMSLSARRAWIEIFFPRIPHGHRPRRSPQGERG